MFSERLALLAAVMLAGCSAPPVTDAPQFGAITARFVTARDDQVIEIRTLDRFAISVAALVMPDGSRTPSYAIDTVADPSPPPDSPIGPSEKVTLIGQIASSALIRVTYPADYAAHWRQTRIELTLGHGDDATNRVIDAPPPD
jgi:hypothetical protein